MLSQAVGDVTLSIIIMDKKLILSPGSVMSGKAVAFNTKISTQSLTNEVIFVSLHQVFGVGHSVRNYPPRSFDATSSFCFSECKSRLHKVHLTNELFIKIANQPTF